MSSTNISTSDYAPFELLCRYISDLKLRGLQVWPTGDDIRVVSFLAEGVIARRSQTPCLHIHMWGPTGPYSNFPYEKWMFSNNAILAGGGQHSTSVPLFKVLINSLSSLLLDALSVE